MTADPKDPRTDSGIESEPVVGGRTLLLGVVAGVLFGLGLLVTESVGELAVDVDFKPFFLPYLLLLIPRFGVPTLAIGLGAAVGEGVLDIFEGYELDDPIGFLGYVFGFLVYGWYLANWAEDPTSTRSLTIGSLLGAFVQALFEGTAFFVFGTTTTPLDASISVLGNTITHGLLLGAIPLIALAPWLRGRVQTRLG